jgi:hypothetical protein
MRTFLNVNSDGAAASYLPSDHGFTYVANGIALMVAGHRVGCSKAGPHCTAKFLEDESKKFAAGTNEFCAFGFEAEKSIVARTPVACAGGLVVGNAKGKPKIGGQVRTLEDKQAEYYLSTTSLKHTVGGASAYIDSMSVPFVVVPDSRASDLGQIVWVWDPSTLRGTFAVAGDVGPRFGEGSIALHQLLRTGQHVAQLPGPIPKSLRCSGRELTVLPPFQSKPTIKGDVCKKGKTPSGEADVRAYIGIDSVDSIFLGKARFNVQGKLVHEELTIDSISKLAISAGYTVKTLESMVACLKPREAR